MVIKREYECKVRIKGKIYTVHVKRLGEVCYATVDDGTDHEIRIERIDNTLPFLIWIDKKQYKTQLIKPDEKDMILKLNGKAYESSILELTRKIPTYQITKRTLIHKEPIRKKPRVYENAVTAPMTGLISSVKIEVGKTVKEDDVILTLNAMKMENEIHATKSGKIKEILVKEGNSVEEGDPLVVID